jgi:flavin-dependent dehydrogenase
VPIKAAVIGAGPAGLSAALGLLRAGIDTTVYEQRDSWTGRVCGAFLNSEAVRHLEWLGVSSLGSPVATATLHDDNGRSTSLPVNGLALSRKELEDALADAVMARGGTIQFGSHRKEIPNADVVINAGGRFATNPSPALSPLGRGTFLKKMFAPPREGRGKGRGGWYGWNATFENIPQKPGELSMHFFPGGYVGVITFADGTSNVCGLFKRKEKGPIDWRRTHAHAIAHAPTLKKLLADAAQTSEWRGVGPLPFSLSMTKSTGALLAGDAAAVGDPYMGEGLGRALSAGPMIHQAWTETGGENLNARYQKLWQNHYSSRLRLGQLTRVLLGSTPFFHVVMRLTFRPRGPLVRVLPIFHRGFHGPHISYS